MPLRYFQAQTDYKKLNINVRKHITKYLCYGGNNIIKQEKADDDMSTYIKEIQATPTLSGKDAIDIVRQVLRTPSPESIDKKKKMFEARKRIEKKCV